MGLKETLEETPGWQELGLSGDRVADSVAWLCLLRNKHNEMGQYLEWCTAISCEFLALMIGESDVAANMIMAAIVKQREQLRKPETDEYH